MIFATSALTRSVSSEDIRLGLSLMNLRWRISTASLMFFFFTIVVSLTVLRGSEGFPSNVAFS